MRSRKHTWRTIGVMVAVLTLGPIGPASAQQMKMVTIGGDEATASHMIGELGALIMEIDSTLEVAHVMEAGMRPEVYKDVDLQKDDIIRMANGKKTRTVDDLIAALEDIKVGEEIKIAFKRGKETRFVSFAKADPKDLPQVQMMTMTMGDEGDSEGEGEGEGGEGGMKMVTKTMGGPGSNQDIAVLMGSGIIAAKQDDKVVVANLMPDFKEVLPDADVKEGDQILKVQGKAVKTAAELQAAYDDVAVGDEVALVLSRDGKENTITFEKAKPRGMMIKRGN